jgi:hypothetical protein
VERSFHSDLIAATKNSLVVEFAGWMAAGLRVFDPIGMLPEADSFCFDAEVAFHMTIRRSCYPRASRQTDFSPPKVQSNSASKRGHLNGAVQLHPANFNQRSHFTSHQSYSASERRWSKRLRRWVSESLSVKQLQRELNRT